MKLYCTSLFGIRLCLLNHVRNSFIFMIIIVLSSDDNGTSFDRSVHLNFILFILRGCLVSQNRK